MKNVFKINKADNVAVALTDLKAGETIQVDGRAVTLNDSVAAGHKVALDNIAAAGQVIKYGAAMGRATMDIRAGDHVHVHNVATNLGGSLTYEYTPKHESASQSPRSDTFQGYKRANGDVGIRNELWIIPTVGCVNGVCQAILAAFKGEVDAGAVDHLQVFEHDYGCSQLGGDHENTVKVLADLAGHPNAGGVLVVGLGCENNQVDAFKKVLGEWDDRRVKFMVAQEEGDEVAAGVALLKEIYGSAKNDRREPVPVSALRIGLECGGSDGFSGLTANPMLGAFSDMLVASGGTAVLTEVPEMFGAETVLMERCKDRAVFDRTVRLINDFKDYFADHNQPVYENPSPGNKKGGITTLEEKSLGCITKGGTAPVNDVYDYGEWIKSKGLVLLRAPGNDLVATTALGASGCHMVLFSTGRGTPFGGFVPTIKVSTNTPLYNRKKHWIDFNAGSLLAGAALADLSEAFFRYVLEVAGGKPVRNEINNMRRMAIWKTGVTL